MRKKAVALLGGVFLAAIQAGADTIELTPVKDNTLYEDAEGRFSNGAGQHLFAGKNAKNFRRRGLIAFDVAAALPAGASVESVELTLHMSRSIAAAEEVELRRMAADWGEGAADARVEEGAGIEAQAADATWTHAFAQGAAWALPGGVFAATPSAVQVIGDVGYYRWESTARLVADVQGWLDDPGTSFGWALVGNETSASTAKRFDSREEADPGMRPVLLVEFVAPGGETAVAVESWGSVKAR